MALSRWPPPGILSLVAAEGHGEPINAASLSCGEVMGVILIASSVVVQILVPVSIAGWAVRLDDGQVQFLDGDGLEPSDG